MLPLLQDTLSAWAREGSVTSAMMVPRAAFAAGLLGVMALAGAVTPGVSLAQSPESDLTPEGETLARDAGNFALPDFTDQELESGNIEDARDRFSMKLGIALLFADYTDFTQDDASIQQVGEQQDKYEPRSLRLMARGHYELFTRWNYVASFEYNGFEWEPGLNKWAITDLRVSTTVGRLGTLTIGKMKEPFSYEMVGDAANLPHSERLLGPFFRSRNVGIQLSSTFANERATWTGGWYNGSLAKGLSWDDAGNDFVGRVTVLPLWSGDGDTYLHVAASLRYYGADADQLRYKGRPASNVADNYVDTGNIPGDHAWHTGLEALLNVRQLSLLAEYVHADLNTDDHSDPGFSGYYLTGSWVITGEHRPYDRKAGYARRVLPQGRWGAVELIARHGKVDLDSRNASGGTMEGWWVGVNWWATRRWKASIGYGDIDLDRFGYVGNTKTVLSRLQWIF
jgi:phosphate-selective porin OprO and OprP